MILKSLFNAVITALFPSVCICCGETLHREEFICDYCNEMIRHVDMQNYCVLCGNEKHKGNCKRIFHFEGVVAPFYNGDLIQKAFYNFKLFHKEYMSRYFAEEMAKCVKLQFSNIEFDAITFVPMSFLGKLKKGFNHSEVLASRLAQILELPLLPHALYCKARGKGQHNLDGYERFLNVRGIYGFKHKINCKNILLIDDIKTTGASLDECARQLLFAGVHHVYCAAALASEKKSGKEKRKNGN